MLAQIVETIDDLTGSLADSRDLLEMAAEATRNPQIALLGSLMSSGYRRSVGDAFDAEDCDTCADDCGECASCGDDVCQVVPPATSHLITIKAFSFIPEGLVIHAGDTVRWTNVDSDPHTATADGDDPASADENRRAAEVRSSTEHPGPAKQQRFFSW